ncbi:MAG TPA: DUF2019 domain-containing protein [Alphaproteobacteria bacterium]|jgi:hypothetical protein|nr:DUF2019 domain-containing protein [Alphaproteobacteria bacterium]
MSNLNLSDVPTEELVDRFSENGVAQDQALLHDNIEGFTRLYWQMDAINEELKSRGEEARLALLKLYGHPNMQVRLAAAVRTLAVATAAAKHELEAVKDSRHFPQAGDAASTLSSLAEGRFKPT